MWHFVHQNVRPLAGSASLKLGHHHLRTHHIPNCPEPGVRSKLTPTVAIVQYLEQLIETVEQFGGQTLVKV